MGVALICAKLVLVPVVFDHDSDVPFSVIKALVSHALTYVLIGVIAGLVIQHRRAVLVWSWLHVPVLAFLLANGAATVFAVDPLLALFGAHTRMIGLGTIADCVVLYFAITFLVRTGRDVLAIGLAFLLGSVVVLAYELVQFVGKDPFAWAIDSSARPFSTVGQTTSLAEYLIVVAVGVAAVAVLGKALPVIARMLLLLYSGLAVAGTVATQTRSALLGLLVGASVLIVLTWAGHPHPRARTISVIGAAVAAAVLGLVLFATPLGTRVLGTIEGPVAAEGDSGLQLEGAADARVALYRIAFEMVRDRPLLGIGPDSFLARLPSYRSPAEPSEVQDNPTTSAHSWVAQVAATSGLVGLTAFLAIAVVAVVLTFRTGFRPDAWAALGMLGAFLGAALTTVNAIATDWLFWAAVGTIAASTSQTSPRSTSAAESTGSRRTRSAATRPFGGAGVAVTYLPICLGLVLALSTVGAVDASRSARASQLFRLQGQAQLAIDAGLRATRADAQRAQYWDTLGLAFISGNRVSEAVSAFERASKLAPYDVRYDGDLARALAVLAQRGDTSSAARAREVVDRVIRTDPNNPLAHQTRAVVMQVTGNFAEALRSSERALTLDQTTTPGYPGNRDIYLTGVQVLNSLGRPADAIDLARRAIARLTDELARLPIRIELARTLLATAQPAEALTQVDLVLAARPGDPNAQQLRSQIRAALGN